MQCVTINTGFVLNFSTLLGILLVAVTVGGGWHLGRWLIWLATHRFGHQ